MTWGMRRMVGQAALGMMAWMGTMTMVAVRAAAGDKHGGSSRLMRRKMMAPGRQMGMAVGKCEDAPDDESARCISAERRWCHVKELEGGCIKVVGCLGRSVSIWVGHREGWVLCVAQAACQPKGEMSGSWCEAGRLQACLFMDLAQCPGLIKKISGVQFDARCTCMCAYSTGTSTHAHTRTHAHTHTHTHAYTPPVLSTGLHPRAKENETAVGALQGTKMVQAPADKPSARPQPLMPGPWGCKPPARTALRWGSAPQLKEHLLGRPSTGFAYRDLLANHGCKGAGDLRPQHSQPMGLALSMTASVASVLWFDSSVQEWSAMSHVSHIATVSRVSHIAGTGRFVLLTGQLCIHPLCTAMV
eukprot:1149775-Pelagomonas_calceolata.AAC.13